jgi:N-acetylmuramoyl-L-alanine amidase
MASERRFFVWLPAVALFGPLLLAGCRESGRTIEFASPGPQSRPAPEAAQRPTIPLPLPRLTNATIVVDPGHGGSDPGAWEHTQSRLPEKTIVLDIAREVASILRQQGGKVIMTRDDDRRIELHARAAIAKEHRADLLLSIHANSATNREAVGTEVYVSRSASARSEQIARQVEAAFRRASFASRGVRRGNFVVLVGHTQPGVLVECGFLSNRNDAARLNDPACRRKFARAIAEGVLYALATPSVPQLTSPRPPAPSAVAAGITAPGASLRVP